MFFIVNMHGLFVCSTLCMYRSDENFVELVLAFYVYVGSGDQTQVLRLTQQATSTEPPVECAPEDIKSPLEVCAKMTVALLTWLLAPTDQRAFQRHRPLRGQLVLPVPALWYVGLCEVQATSPCPRICWLFQDVLAHVHDLSSPCFLQAEVAVVIRAPLSLEWLALRYQQQCRQEPLVPTLHLLWAFKASKL